MNKHELYNYLDTLNISYEITEHEAAYNMSDMAEISLPYPEYDAKNLFIRDDKKQKYYLLTVCGNKKVDLKSFRKNNNTRPLSFASENDLMNILQLSPGSVTPLGLLNDKERITHLFLDSDFFKRKAMIGVHPNDNTATIWLKTEDLKKVIKKHGNLITIVDF